jgi:arylsulfatase A-like enzyme
MTGTTYAAQPVACGAPTYDKATEAAAFLWNDCGTNQWHLRVTAGGLVLRYQGSVTADQPFDSLTGFSVEATDLLQPAPFLVPTPGPLTFGLSVGSAGTDGFDFRFPAGSRTCFELTAPSAQPVLAGANRLAVGTAVNLNDFGPCNTAAYTLSAADITVTETDGHAAFLVTLSPSPSPGTQVAISFATVDGSARSESDFTAVSGTLTFLAGETQHTVLVPLIDDEDSESNETFGLELTSAETNAVTSTATIRDNENIPLNIVVILSDDQRWDTLWSMPSIENLASRGMTFSNAFVSNPICGPSRASILSNGFRSANTGITQNVQSMSPIANFNDRDTLPVHLQQAGYQTFFTGKYLNGYSTIAGYVPPGWTRWVANNGGPEQQPWNNYRVTIGTSGKESATGSIVGPIRTYVTDYQKDQVLSFLETVGSQPFFVFWAAFPPHSPATPAVEDQTLFDDYLYRDRAWGEADLSDKPSWVGNVSQFKDSHKPSDTFHRAQLRSLQALDRGVAEVVDKVTEIGAAGRTVFFFLGDNGYLWGEHGLSGKGLAYDESVHVPLVVFGAEVTSGVDNRLVYADLDLGPTVMEIAGLSCGNTDGRSLWPLLRGENPAWRESLLFESWGAIGYGPYETWAALRTKRWKYIRQASGEEELYDLIADPFELQNLRTDAEFDAVRTNLASQLDAEKALALKVYLVPNGRLGRAYALQLDAWGGSRNYRWAIESGSLPAGLSLNTQTGLISGIPTTAGTWSARIRVEDGTWMTHSLLPSAHATSYTFTIK